jgi:predicted AlkP superfamily pyrophosphatase or phosphodiesterase
MCEKSSVWQFERELVKAPSVFDLAKENGLTTAAVFWPVTGNDRNIDYLINEYWPQHGESSEQCFRDSGSSDEVIEKVVRPNLKILENRHRQHPFCDVFIMQCACDMLTQFKPNLLMVHPANVDSYRHGTGLFTTKVETGLHETNLWFAQLMKAADDAGILDQTDFFIVSDHGQMEIRRSVALNVFFAEKGLIDVDEKGEIRDWTAFAKSSGMSSQIYLKHPDCPEALARTKAVLDEMLASETAGISEVFTAQEAREKHHLAGDFSFVVETDNYTTFSNDWLRPVIKPLDNRNYRFGRATHGHLPHKGPQPTLVAFGPHIKPGVVLENALLVDEAPTFAHALGLKMENVDGRTLNELFND